mmetsp:Transcript_17349/g.16557  ORF Transcript_17349/g.16557 Transcript_17349/m.16557 type:complete len:115 (-) Transcript_17349:46-390(-)
MMGKSLSLPELNKSQVQPYLMNIKFSRQLERKALAVVEPNEQRFESLNLLPDNWTNNTKLTRNVLFDKYSDRQYPWVKATQGSPVYDPIDVEKYKYVRSHVPKIYNIKKNVAKS